MYLHKKFPIWTECYKFLHEVLTATSISKKDNIYDYPILLLILFNVSVSNYCMDVCWFAKFSLEIVINIIFIFNHS